MSDRIERPDRPAYRVDIYSSHMKRVIETFVVLPDGVYPMDLYNALSSFALEVPSIHYGWITTKNRYIDSEAAAVLALDTNMLDKKVTHLSIEDYQGSWRYGNLNKK